VRSARPQAAVSSAIATGTAASRSALTAVLPLRSRIRRPAVASPAPRARPPS
jgi:hypothetical protein